MTRVRIIGPGRAGRSLGLALGRVGWEVAPMLGRGDDVTAAALGTDLLVIATPDAAVADVSAAIDSNDDTVVAHLSGALGLSPLVDHVRTGVLHPLVALPDPERGAARLVGAWFGTAVGGDPVIDDAVAALPRSRG